MPGANKDVVRAELPAVMEETTLALTLNVKVLV
jgi:hypothetical protein